MILAVDVYYIASTAKAVGVLFNWDDTTPQKIITIVIDGIEEYLPGKFYKRELPCILKIIEQVDLSDVEAIIVDGHVYVNEKEFGLGGKLYEALDSVVPVIGVGKNAFHSNTSTVHEIYRGDSSKPLYVSAIGMDAKHAVEKIANMEGKYRFPEVLKNLDPLTKQ